jgi:formylglycine-generating enzyme required for sulfatase activity
VGITPAGLPDIDWVTIPGGEFVYQDGERRRIDPFRIARYPITNGQWRAFLDAPDGYRNDRWWAGLDDPDRTPAQPRWDLPNQPREMVSWHEAMAFCAWLGERLGLAVTLPTELQWERAARGTAGREYPWGDGYRPGHANIDETWEKGGPHHLGQTTAVGIYPQGASPEGVLDLSGNVWELCLNEYDSPQRTQRGGTATRVVRGGSWDYDLSFARAAYRVHSLPLYRFDNLGFRLVCASPIC